MSKYLPILWSGYFFVKKPDHYRANKQGYVKVADLVAESSIGRRLLPNEITHHIDGNKLNDAPNNLRVMDKVKHDTLHLSQYSKPFKAGNEHILWRDDLDKSKQEIINLFKNGESLRSIAKQFETDHHTIKRRLSSWNV